MFGENSMDCRFSTQAHDSRCVLLGCETSDLGKSVTVSGFHK